MIRRAAALALVALVLSVSAPAAAEAGQLVEKVRAIAAQAKAKIAQKLAEGVEMAVMLSHCARAEPEGHAHASHECRPKAKPAPR